MAAAAEEKETHSFEVDPAQVSNVWYFEIDCTRLSMIHVAPCTIGLSANFVIFMVFLGLPAEGD